MGDTAPEPVEAELVDGELVDAGPDPKGPGPSAPDPSAPDPTAPDPSAANSSAPDPTAPGPTAPVEAEVVEQVAPAAPVAGLTPDYDEHGVPSFDYVRDKIENRYTTSVGAGELAAETPEGRSLEQQIADRDKAAAARLEEIRRSLGH